MAKGVTIPWFMPLITGHQLPSTTPKRLLLHPYRFVIMPAVRGMAQLGSALQWG